MLRLPVWVPVASQNCASTMQNINSTTSIDISTHTTGGSFLGLDSVRTGGGGGGGTGLGGLGFFFGGCTGGMVPPWEPLWEPPREPPSKTCSSGVINMVPLSLYCSFSSSLRIWAGSA